jgi:hypothetical protein
MSFIRPGWSPIHLQQFLTALKWGIKRRSTIGAYGSGDKRLV